MWECRLCKETDIADVEVLDHIRLMHPDDYAALNLEVWPDGYPVIDEEIENPGDLSW